MVVVNLFLIEGGCPVFSSKRGVTCLFLKEGDCQFFFIEEGLSVFYGRVVVSFVFNR